MDNISIARLNTGSFKMITMCFVLWIICYKEATDLYRFNLVQQIGHHCSKDLLWEIVIDMLFVNEIV